VKAHSPPSTYTNHTTTLPPLPPVAVVGACALLPYLTTVLSHLHTHASHARTLAGYTFRSHLRALPFCGCSLVSHALSRTPFSPALHAPRACHRYTALHGCSVTHVTRPHHPAGGRKTLRCAFTRSPRFAVVVLRMARRAPRRLTYLSPLSPVYLFLPPLCLPARIRCALFTACGRHSAPPRCHFCTICLPLLLLRTAPAHTASFHHLRTRTCCLHALTCATTPYLPFCAPPLPPLGLQTPAFYKLLGPHYRLVCAGTCCARVVR